MTVLELVQWCTKRQVDMSKVQIVVSDDDYQDDFTSLGNPVYNGEQVILYKEQWNG